MLSRFASFAAVALSLAAGLAACSGEPSEADMKAAVEKSEAFQVQKQMAQLLGGMNPKLANVANLQISKLEKIACKGASEQPGYMCDFQMTINGNVVPGNGRFLAASDGWKYMVR